MDEKYNGMDNESHILFVLKEIRQLLYTEGNLQRGAVNITYSCIRASISIQGWTGFKKSNRSSIRS